MKSRIRYIQYWEWNALEVIMREEDKRWAGELRAKLDTTRMVAAAYERQEAAHSVQNYHKDISLNLKGRVEYLILNPSLENRLYSLFAE